MALIPSAVTWPDTFLTSVQFNKYASFLTFLAYRNGGFCELSQTQTQDIPENTDYPIVFQNEEVDRDGGHSDLDNLSRYNVKTSGVYLLSGQVAFAANATGFRAAKLMKNGGGGSPETLATTLRPAQAGGIEAFIPVGSWIGRLNAGDYVELRARQNSGTTLKTSIADAGCGMSIMFLGA
jgi:hypothetical protein